MTDKDAAEVGDSQPYEPKYQPGPPLLGSVTVRRREVLALTQEDVDYKFDGPSVATLRTIEGGQSGNFRAKTLFALDHALSWPSGSSHVLITGNLTLIAKPERVKIGLLDERTKHDLEPEPWRFDKFVDHLIKSVSDRDILRYGINVPSPEPLPSSDVLAGLAIILEDGTTLDEGEVLQSFRERARRRQSDKQRIMETLFILTGFADDARIKEAMHALAPLAFAGLLNNWDIYDENGNINLPPKQTK